MDANKPSLTEQLHSSSGSYDLVLSGVLFGLLVLALYRWLGTTPWCMVGATLFGFVGATLSIYYRYRHDIAVLEAKRDAARNDVATLRASAPGRVFSRAQLLENVWGYDFYGDERVVDVHIRGMRAALGDDASNPQIIGTVRGVGYKFLKKASA